MMMFLVFAYVGLHEVSTAVPFLVTSCFSSLVASLNTLLCVVMNYFHMISCHWTSLMILNLVWIVLVLINLNLLRMGIKPFLSPKKTTPSISNYKMSCLFLDTYLLLRT